VAIGHQTSMSGGSADGQQQAQEVAHQAQQKAQEVAGQAQQQAQQAAGKARDLVRGQVTQRSTDAGEQLSGQAGDMRAVAEQLREQGKDRPAQLAEEAAQRAERVGSYLKESDADRILADVEDFARRRPWAVVGGGIALGLVASRFLKASSTERHRQASQRAKPALPPAAFEDAAARGSGHEASAADGRAAGVGAI
jgi:ElaB/YqjD/DUF883 family membrane-anchored ribosome-binding protein